MKKFFVLFAILLSVTFLFPEQSLESDLDPMENRGDWFDQEMYKQYPDWWKWPERTRNGFRRQFNEAKNKHIWFPDMFEEPEKQYASIRPK